MADNYTADALLDHAFPEPSWVLPDWLPEGVCLLGGKPKIGKSWLALDLSCAVAGGHPAVGSLPVEQGDVLYLALEDQPRRMSKRLRLMLGEVPPPPRLHLSFQASDLDHGGDDDVRDWIEKQESPRLIVIDTLAMVRQDARFGTSIYQSDYEAIVPFRDIASEYGIGVVIVHHLRKQEADDPLDTLSGSTGLPGAADSVWILSRGRHEANAVLTVTGRDLEEREAHLQFDSPRGRWSIGSAPVAPADEPTPQRRDITTLIVEHGGPLHYRAVSDALGKEETTVRWLMADMVKRGELLRVGKGEYDIPTNQQEVCSRCPYKQDEKKEDHN